MKIDRYSWADQHTNLGHFIGWKLDKVIMGPMNNRQEKEITPEKEVTLWANLTTVLSLHEDLLAQAGMLEFVLESPESQIRQNRAKKYEYVVDYGIHSVDYETLTIEAHVKDRTLVAQFQNKEPFSAGPNGPAAKTWEERITRTERSTQPNIGSKVCMCSKCSRPCCIHQLDMPPLFR